MNGSAIARNIVTVTGVPVSLLERLRLAFQRAGSTVARPPARLLLREASYPLSPLTRRLRPQPAIMPAARPQVILMLPGFLAHPVTMGYLARQLERAGHITRRWGLGFNLGPTHANIGLLEQRLEDVHRRHGQEVVLLGWSLGGLFARELARRRPELVAKVITMGSPFSGDPRANNAWRLYQFVTGHPVDNPPVEVDNAAKPPVETVALWSPRDGIVAPRSARGWPGERDRAMTVRCTHMGFSYSARAIEALLRELAAG